MDKTTGKDLPYDKAIGDILGIVNCLLIISDVGSFIKWIKEFHFSEVTNKHLPGYKLTFNTLFRMLTSELERNTSLGLTSDDIFDRATFRGISINKVPNTCEKAILFRNLQYYFNQVINSNDWPNFKKAMQKLSIEVLASFVSIKKVALLNKHYPVLEIETAVTYSSMFQTYIFLNDTNRGIPHGYLPSMLDDQEADFGFQFSAAQTLSDTFWSYKYAIQFLWHQLLRDKFKSSVISDIHKTNDWNSFDKYFNKIQSEIIEPLEKSTGGFSGYDLFILIDKSPKEYFKNLLEKKILEKELSQKDFLERVFLWYPIHVINCYDYDFGGVPVLIPLLKGMARERANIKNKSKIKLVRLIHGKAEDHRRDYSYAVLIGLYGMISDASGWMLFYDCCSDQGGSSGLYKAIETRLGHYQELGSIDIQNIRIEKTTFAQIMENNIVSEGILPNDE